MKKISPKKVKAAAVAAKVGIIAAMALAAQAGLIAQPLNEVVGGTAPV